ncbi:hypothetical protein Pcac1_g27826 [Phytophthora cactorum]|nr:hypothetical protein Pcac1_g27826 [Phytophthora cactorum]
MLSLLDTGTPACCSDRPIAQHPPSTTARFVELSRAWHGHEDTRGDLGGLNDASDAPQELACVQPIAEPTVARAMHGGFSRCKQK